MVDMPSLPPAIVVERTTSQMPPDIYSRLLKDRIIWVGSKIDASVANIVMAQLLFLENEDSNEEIFMYINSPGGSVDAVLGIYDTIQFIQPDVMTICAGGSYGLATLLLSAGTRGKRYALPNALLNLHSPRADITGYAPEVKVAEGQAKKIEERIGRLLAQHTGQTLEKIAEDFQADRYFTPEEALEYGLIDEILNKSPELVAQG